MPGPCFSGQSSSTTTPPPAAGDVGLINTQTQDPCLGSRRGPTFTSESGTGPHSGLLGSGRLSPTRGPLAAPCSLAAALWSRFYSPALPPGRIDFRAREYVVQENLQVGYSLETS